jgi:hypothetical protein
VHLKFSSPDDFRIGHESAGTGTTKGKEIIADLARWLYGAKIRIHNRILVTSIQQEPMSSVHSETVATRTGGCPMKKSAGLFLLLLCILPGLACSLPDIIATPTPSGPCTLSSSEEISIFNRPTAASDIFSSVPAGFSNAIDAFSTNGWYGFDPGIAQAANIGPFRMRWVDPADALQSGDCRALPILWSAPAGICFDMPMGDTNVHELPDSGSAILTVLHHEEFAAVLGTNPGGWAKVDLGPGNTGLTIEGWVESSSLNMNGPCASLPTLP